MRATPFDVASAWDLEERQGNLFEEAMQNVRGKIYIIPNFHSLLACPCGYTLACDYVTQFESPPSAWDEHGCCDMVQLLIRIVRAISLPFIQIANS